MIALPEYASRSYQLTRSLCSKPPCSGDLGASERGYVLPADPKN